MALQAAPTFSAEPPNSALRYLALGLEGTDWTTSFQVTPLNASWGIPYQDQRTWGLDPYFFENGSITAGVAGIAAGERQRLAFLIGGHDSGLGASAALDAYLQTNDSRYLKTFDVYFDYFRNAQIPGGRSRTPALALTSVAGRQVTIDNGGFWAEQANVSAGTDGRYGTANDSATLLAVYSSPEHGNPIAAALIGYYRWSKDDRALQMLNHYGSWLVKLQIKEGNFSGAFPVTQYYWNLGWKPRMFETTESAWILAELYLLTGNRTYLNSAQAAGQYMVSKQFTGPEWSNTPVYGALPYEWNGTKYTDTVLTNHAGFTLLAWTQLFRITGDNKFLTAAETYANWLLSFQVTTPDIPWGNRTYANDSMAVGGYYYGYNTEKHEFGSRVALSLWSAAYAIPGLLLLWKTANDEAYLRSALLAADWLTRMRYNEISLIPLQALAITKYAASSWWGLYPQFYQPDMRQVEKAGIPTFVERGRENVSAILNKNPTWFEKAFNVDFNLIDYQMASRGPQFMKMVWSWWPSVGFEPRYGGDIAFGAFAIGNYLAFANKLQSLQTILREIEKLTSNQPLGLPRDLTASYNQAQQLVKEAQRNFSEGWYSTAVAKINEATALAQDDVKQLGILAPFLQTSRIILEGLVVALVVLAVAGAYLYGKLRRSLSSQRTRRRAGRNRARS